MRARRSGRSMGIGARRGPRHAARRVAVACVVPGGARGVRRLRCGARGRRRQRRSPAARHGSTAPDGTPSSGATVPAVDTEHAVDPPPKLTDSTLPADMLIFSQQALSDDVVEAIKALDGVAAVERLGMGTALVENRAITVASVDPATYRRFTLAAVAQQQDIWDRVAGGEMAMPTRLGKRLRRQGRVREARQRQGRPRGAHRRLRAAGAEHRRGRQREVGQGARGPAGQRADHLDPEDLPAVRPAQGREAPRRGHLDPAARRGDPLRPRPGRPADRDPHRWLGRAGGRLVLLPGARRRPDRPRQRLGAGQHPHRAGADPRQRDLPQGDAAAAAGRAHRGAGERPGRQDPPGRVRRVLLPALHRRVDLAEQPLVRHRPRHERARQPARHRPARWTAAWWRSSSAGASAGAATGTTPTPCTSR